MEFYVAWRMMYVDILVLVWLAAAAIFGTARSTEPFLTSVSQLQ